MFCLSFSFVRSYREATKLIALTCVFSEPTHLFFFSIHFLNNIPCNNYRTK